MIDRVAGDAVAVVHLLFIVFVVGGGALVLAWPRIAWLHLPAAVWGAYAELTSTICPLTPFENGLRLRAGQSGYEGGFVERYLMPIIYPAGLTPNVQLVLGATVVAVNIAFYAIVWQRSRQRGAMTRPTPD